MLLKLADDVLHVVIFSAGRPFLASPSHAFPIGRGPGKDGRVRQLRRHFLHDDLLDLDFLSYDALNLDFFDDFLSYDPVNRDLLDYLFRDDHLSRDDLLDDFGLAACGEDRGRRGGTADQESGL